MWQLLLDSFLSPVSAGLIFEGAPKEPVISFSIQSRCTAARVCCGSAGSFPECGYCRNYWGPLLQVHERNRRLRKASVYIQTESRQRYRYERLSSFYPLFHFVCLRLVNSVSQAVGAQTRYQWTVGYFWCCVVCI